MSAVRDERMRQEGLLAGAHPGPVLPLRWHAHWRCLERLREQIRARAEARQ